MSLRRQRLLRIFLRDHAKFYSGSREFAGVQYFAFAHGPDVICGEGKYGCGGSFSGYKLNLESIGRVAMEHCSDVALLEMVFLYVVDENDGVQFFNDGIPSRQRFRPDRP